MLVQKTKISWLRDGDSNSNFFYAVVKERHTRSTIDHLTSLTGETLESDKEIADEITNIYSQLLGTAHSCLMLLIVEL